MARIARLFALGFALVLVACGGDNPAGPPVVSSVVVTPGADTLLTLGRTRQFTGVARDASGNPVSGVTLVWSSSNPSVATVDASTGVVTAVGNGLSVIRADAGGVQGQATLAVTQVVAAVVVSPPSAGFTAVGDTQRLAAVAKDSSGAIVQGVRFLWQSSDQAIATVDTGGLLRSRGPGQTFITAAGRGVPGFAVVTVTQAAASLVFAVQPANAIAGEALNPALQVEVRDSSGHLVSGSRAAITLAFGVNPHGATLHGSTIVNAVGGVATFSGLTVERADSGYTLVAHATAINQGTSAAFNVGPTAAKGLRFAQLAPEDTAGHAPPFLVQTVDRFGNVTPVNGTAFISLAAHPAGGDLVGNQLAFITNGVANLSQLSIEKAGAGYVLVATGGGGAAGLDSALSPAFTVRPATATNLVFAHVDTSQILGFVLYGTAVQIQDVFGNQADTLVTVTLSLGPNLWGAGLLGSTTEIGFGLVTYPALIIDKPGDYGVIASAPGFAPETSATVTITLRPVYVIAAGGTHTCMLAYPTSGGQNTFCWGANGVGQLGRPASPGDSVPGLVSDGGREFVALAAGPGHNCAITAAGAAYCWGDNNRGQLGSVTGTSASDSAQAVAGGHVFTAITGGGKHTCALAADSTAYCWGDNFSGQLGDSGREANSSTPVAVYGGRKYIAIAAGQSHTCAVGADSSAYCWGAGGFGQLGDSAVSVVRDTAVLVKRGHKFRAVVTAGSGHTCAVDDLGLPLCWGLNNHGQLGDHLLGVNSDTAVFVASWGGIEATLLVAGGDHTCAVRGDLTTFCWGSNASGELGSGTPPTDIDQPAAVTFSFGPSGLAAGSAHSCGIATTLFCWGKNQAGQVGDGTTVDRSQPVPVFKQ